MAKTMYSIRMDFAKAENQAEKLDQIAKNLEKLANDRMGSCLQGISSNWKGENANAFRRKGDQVGDNLRKLVKNLQKSAATIREIAKKTYDAEKRVYELAQKREYGN